MTMYRVCVQMTVSAVVEVEANDLDEAMESYYDSPDMPGGITIGAFGQASVDESGDWEPTEVYVDDSHEPIWTSRS